MSLGGLGGGDVGFRCLGWISVSSSGGGRRHQSPETYAQSTQGILRELHMYCCRLVPPFVTLKALVFR